MSARRAGTLRTRNGASLHVVGCTEGVAGRFRSSPGRGSARRPLPACRRDLFAARVENGPRFLHGLRCESRVLDLVVAPLERVLVLGPHALEDGEELFRPCVALVMLNPGPTVHVALDLPPGAHNVQGEPAVRDPIDG